MKKLLFNISFYWLLAAHFFEPVFGSSLDLSFDPGPGSPETIEAIALQKDGKILVGGFFTTFNNQRRTFLARLASNGTLDPSFQPEINDWVRTISIQEDGKIIVGGTFTRVNGEVRNRIARIYPDGSLDTTFNPGDGFDSHPYTSMVQSDGRILVGGTFTKFNNFHSPGLVRLNANGSRDTSFNVGSGANSWVKSVNIQPDGKILAVGWFWEFNGQSRRRIVRLLPDGSLDQSFYADSNSSMYTVAIQRDGKMVVAGHFDQMNGVSRIKLARLNPDGSTDMTFNPGADGFVNYITLLKDGRFFMSGYFNNLGGQPVQRVALVNPDGTVDQSFKASPNEYVLQHVEQEDGKVIAVGGFSSIDGVSRGHVARFHVDEVPLSAAISRIVRKRNTTQVFFNSIAGCSYELQRCTSMQSNQWTSVEKKSGIGGEMFFSEISSQPAAFYRISVTRSSL